MTVRLHPHGMLGCDHVLHQHLPARAQSAPLTGGVKVLVDTAVSSEIRTCMYRISCICMVMY